MVNDYKNRTYLSSIEAAKLLKISVRNLHDLTKNGEIYPKVSASGQKRYILKEVKKMQKRNKIKRNTDTKNFHFKNEYVQRNGTVQRIMISDSTSMKGLEDNSIHLMITSPPYFNAKMYSEGNIKNDLGNIHDLEEWFQGISKVWKEVYRVLQPGRKAFINIMNLPIRTKKSFRTLNLVGRTIEICEELGFIFKRDIIWQKTNGVRAHFGTYPYPGGILINHMHEFILEFHKPEKNGNKKYAHLTKKQKEKSKLSKDFWLSIKNSDVWVMKPEMSGDGRTHVAPFPRELPLRLIKAYSYIGETVLDPFMGSGTVLKVARDLERNGIGYEINPEIATDVINILKNNE